MATTKYRSHMSTVFEVDAACSVQVHRAFNGYDVVSYRNGSGVWEPRGNFDTRSEADEHGEAVADELAAAGRPAAA